MVHVEIVDRVSGRGSRSALDKKTLEAEARRVVEALPGFRVGEAKKDEVRFQLTVEVKMWNERTPDEPGKRVVDGEPGVRRALGLTVSLFPLGRAAGGPKRTDSEVLVTEVVKQSASVRALIQKGFQKARSDVELALKLQRAPESEVVQTLDSRASYARARAISVARDRKLGSAVPKLMRIVADAEEDQNLILLAMGALVAIGDPRAVSALIDAGRQKGVPYLTQILFAIARLGGREAEAYLFTVKSGHASSQVRQVAKEALEELEREKGVGPD